MNEEPETPSRQERITDLRKRLAQLGYPHKNIAPSEGSPAEDTEMVSPDPPARSIASNDSGSCALFTSPHNPPDTRSVTPELLARLAGDPAFASLSLENILFIDTETTGLGGAGVLAFLTGVGRFDTPDTFTIDQYFLRTPADERAMLREIRALITEKTALITFNGKSFDVPLLEGRGLVNRLPLSLGALPHLDLMWIARRIWYRRLGSYSLGTLEQRVLDVQRSGADIPGYLIPVVYTDYLRTGSLHELTRVFYHNEIDVLSMAYLLTRISELMSARPETLPPLDSLSLSRMMLAGGYESEAETHLIHISRSSDSFLKVEALEMLAALLKRQGRRAEAAPLWQEIAEIAFDLSGHEELAKYHEWMTGSLGEAVDWAEKALSLCDTWPEGERKKTALDEWNHRRERLLAKIKIKGG